MLAKGSWKFKDSIGQLFDKGLLWAQVAWTGQRFLLPLEYINPTLNQTSLALGGVRIWTSWVLDSTTLDGTTARIHMSELCLEDWVWIGDFKLVTSILRFLAQTHCIFWILWIHFNYFFLVLWFNYCLVLYALWKLDFSIKRRSIHLD